MTSKQQLNSVERFRKQPGQLVLEAFSHCEVPAGCGGVVLRWRNPHVAVPVTIHNCTPVEPRCWIDGAELQAGRLDLAPGPHVLAMAIANVDVSRTLLLFSALHNPAENQHALPSELVEPGQRVTSAADGTWKYTLVGPAGDDWTALAFDDQDWAALVAVDSPPQESGWEDFDRYQFRTCREAGAVPLGLPVEADKTANPSNVWIRKVFSIAAPGRPGPSS